MGGVSQMGAGWDLSVAAYASKSLSLSTHGAFGWHDIGFSSDGTKAYGLNSAGGTDTIYQYTLSTAWDLSTGSYASKSYTLLSEQVEGMFFRPDGTSVYIVGEGYDYVRQYNLSTAWDISTASTPSQTLYVGSQETNPHAVSLSSDGTKVYIVGSANNTIYQYTLSTAWDMSTGSYASKSFNVSASETSVQGLAFTSDGTKAFVLGPINNTVRRISLSTAWDMSTASNSGPSFSISSQTTEPTGVQFATDGTTMYVIGGTSIYQYTAAVETAASRTIDLELGNYVSMTNASGLTLTFSNPPASGNAGSFVLELINGGNYTVTWPASVDWPEGTAPTLTSSGTDIVVFTTRDGGTTWRGMVSIINPS